MDSRERIEKAGLVWLLVGAVGFVLGLGFVTGPLAWFFGSRLGRRAAQLGIDVPGRAGAARIVGIVTTILTVLFAVAFVVAVVGFGWMILTGLNRAL